MSLQTLAVADWIKLDPWLLLPMVVVAWLYHRGARSGRGSRSCFWLGLLVLLIALSTQIDAMGHLLLWVHMAQHVLLVFVAAPLLVLGAPGMACFRGLPAFIRKDFLGPLLADRWARVGWRILLHPVTTWLVFVATTWGWHTPAAYQLAISDPLWHRLEHVCFLGGAVLFWWQVFEPWPWKSRWTKGARIAYLLAADIQNTVFCAILAFAGTSIYGSYAATAWGLGWDPARDQRLAAGIMWFVGQLVILPAAVWLLLGALKGRAGKPSLAAERERQSLPLPQLGSDPRRLAGAVQPLGTQPHRAARPLDLLRLPVLGACFRSRSARLTLRWLLAICALLLVIDGLWGPEVGPENLAGTIPWTHWRGITAVLLLLVGNVACMVCPMMAPRALGKWLFQPARAAPRWLKGKWVACAILVAWLVAYEMFDFWSSPWATAWVIITYFALAFVIDSLFSGATFCRAVCPIGQYQMVLSLVSPTQVMAREASVCAACSTHDCIRGNPARGTPGCGLDLFMPQKIGNLDCTNCLDCVDSCPSGNVGWIVTSRASNLMDVSLRSGVGFLAQRIDMAVLLLLVTIGAFVNAAAMTPQWFEFLGWLAQGTASLWLEGAAVLVMLVVPTAALVMTSKLRRVGDSRQVLVRGALTLVPMGAAMWVDHFGFHLTSAWKTGLAVVQRALLDLGASGKWVGEPDWIASCCAQIPDWLKPAELVLLDVGLVASLWLVWRSRLSAIWWIAAIGLFAAGVWIVLQPMEMRGNLP